MQRPSGAVNGPPLHRPVGHRLRARDREELHGNHHEPAASTLALLPGGQSRRITTCSRVAEPETRHSTATRLTLERSETAGPVEPRPVLATLGITFALLREPSPPRVSDVGRTFTDAEQLQSVFSEMFTDVADDDGMDGLVAQQMVINFRLHDPSIDIWVDGRARPVTASFEPIGVDATLTAELSADSMHELLLGTLPLGKAVLFRKLKVSGSRSRALSLEPLLHACQAAYPEIVERRL